jgi:hypothetical protein
MQVSEVQDKTIRSFLGWHKQILSLTENHKAGKKKGTNLEKSDLSLGVHPKGFEPLSMVPETTILSIELRVQVL